MSLYDKLVERIRQRNSQLEDSHESYLRSVAKDFIPRGPRRLELRFDEDRRLLTIEAGERGALYLESYSAVLFDERSKLHRIRLSVAHETATVSDIEALRVQAFADAHPADAALLRWDAAARTATLTLGAQAEQNVWRAAVRQFADEHVPIGAEIPVPLDADSDLTLLLRRVDEDNGDPPVYDRAPEAYSLYISYDPGIDDGVALVTMLQRTTALSLYHRDTRRHKLLMDTGTRIDLHHFVHDWYDTHYEHLGTDDLADFAHTPDDTLAQRVGRAHAALSDGTLPSAEADALRARLHTFEQAHNLRHWFAIADMPDIYVGYVGGGLGEVSAVDVPPNPYQVAEGTWVHHFWWPTFLPSYFAERARRLHPALDAYKRPYRARPTEYEGDA